MPEKEKGYTNLTIRKETAKKLLEFAREKNLRTMDYFEQLVQNIEVVRLQNAAVSIAFEDKLTKIWHRLHYVEKSLPGFYKLRDSLLRDDLDVPFFDELTDVIDVRAKIESVLDESYPKWYQNVNKSELIPYVFDEHRFFLPQFEGPLSESQQKFLKSQREWFIKMKKGELKRMIRDFAENLDGCFDNIEELKNILPDAPLVRALEDIMSPLKKTRKALNVLV
jgi:aminopeptidase-like protein